MKSYSAFFCMIMLLSLTNCSNNLKSSVQTSSLSEADATTLMKKFQPVVYFHSNEGYFPTSIENFSIDWSKATINSKEAIYDTKGYKGNTSLKQDAPVYCSIKVNDDGTVRISYLFLYGWNNTGPKIHMKAKLVGVGIDNWVTAGDYGADLHYSDVEHIEIYLKSDKSTVNYMYYAYHQWGTDSGDKIYSNQVEWEGTHPVVYAALGSHASYKSAGDLTYHTAWSEKKKVVGVTVYDTYCVLVDYTQKSKRWFSTNPRLLKLNDAAVSGISNDENYIGFKYSGRLGVEYTNVKWDDLKKYSGYNTFMAALKKVSKSTYNSIDDNMDEIEGLMESKASNGFYSRSYW
jgi:hypothetical protein